MGIEFGGKGKEADIYKRYEKLQERRRVEGNRKAVEATEHLNTAIDTLISTERLFEEANQIVSKDFIRRVRINVENIRNDLARAIAL